MEVGTAAGEGVKVADGTSAATVGVCSASLHPVKRRAAKPTSATANRIFILSLSVCALHNASLYVNYNIKGGFYLLNCIKYKLFGFMQ
jgi:hypothetical protein